MDNELLREMKSTRTELGKRFTEFDKRLKNVELGPQRPYNDPGERPGKSPGHIFTKSQHYSDMLSRGTRSSEPVEVGQFHKRLDSSDTSGGALIEPQRYQELVYPPERPMIVRDLFSVQQATTNLIEYARETGFVNAAAIVPEGEVKPESDLTFELVSAPVRTVATTLTVSNQALEDASQLEGHINNRLRYAVGLVEESQILYGSGIAPNLEGIMVNEDVQVHNQGDHAGDQRIDALRRAMTKVRVAEYPASGIVMHPEDFEGLELVKDNEARYVYFSEPSQGGAGTFWRLPVVESTAIQAGTALVGAFKLGAIVWDRMTASVQISREHSDYFARNLAMLRGESRIALTLLRPEAFVKVNFTAPAA